MFSIYFNGDCFQEFESSLYFIASARSEMSSHEEFIHDALDYLIKENAIYEEYKNRQFVKSTDEDIAFMKSIKDNMKRAVDFDLEDTAEYFTMIPYDVCEHMMILTTDNNYILLYWSTTA